jgi:glycosyltransferase involved in cell wall biosynthesis
MFDFIIASTPVLATRLDAVAAYFPDDAIAFVPPEDAEAMARAIVGLARDPVRREALATRARELYAIYGWDAQREIYLDAIASVMA